MTKREREIIRTELENAWKELRKEEDVCEMLNIDTDTDELYRRCLTKWATLKELSEKLGV